MNLKEFVDYHQQIINLCSKLSEFFKVIVFLEYIVQSCLLCTIAVQLVMGTDLLKMIVAFLHGSAALTDLFIYSFGGQLVMDSSTEVFQDLVRIDKNYRFILHRTQTELKIKSMMFQASFSTFSRIISQTISLITLVKSLM